MIGKLVRITRASIGVPKGTLGLVIRKDEASTWKDEDGDDLPTWFVYKVLLCLPSVPRESRYLERDLEVVEV